MTKYQATLYIKQVVRANNKLVNLAEYVDNYTSQIAIFLHKKKLIDVNVFEAVINGN